MCKVNPVSNVRVMMSETDGTALSQQHWCASFFLTSVEISAHKKLDSELDNDIIISTEFGMPR